MEKSPLQQHMGRTHGKIMIKTHGVDVGVGASETYVVLLPCFLSLVACPVEGRPARAHNLGRIYKNFMYRHWKSNISILQEGPSPLPQCINRGMNMPEVLETLPNSRMVVIGTYIICCLTRLSYKSDLKVAWLKS